MSPALIIQQAALDGVTIQLSSSDTLKAIGNRQAIKQWFPVIRENKSNIIAVLTKMMSKPALFDHELFEERAAIFEYEAELDRSTAEKKAKLWVKNYLLYPSKLRH